MKRTIEKPSVKLMPMVSFFIILTTFSVRLWAQEDIDVGKTGWDVKRPIMAGACDQG